MESGERRAGRGPAFLLGGRIGLRAAIALVCLVACGDPAACAAAEAPPAPTAEPTPEEKELARLRDFLAGPDRTFSTRRDAADALLEKQTDAARAVLVEVLAAPSEAALAVLGVLAVHDGAHEAFIDPLFGLLRSDDETCRKSAALAFGAYPGTPKVMGGLKALLGDAGVSSSARLAAVQALAQVVDRQSVEALVEATSDADPSIASAAAAALADMTGLAAVPVGGWKGWWERYKADPEAKFLRGLVRRFRTELRRREASLAAVQARLSRLLVEIYEVAPAKEKVRLVQVHLEDPMPMVRAMAARQAAGLAREALAGGANGGRAAFQDVLSALVKHIADEGPQVRAACADALAAWQETGAGPALLARLDAEKAPEVRAALAGALGSLKVADAVPRLVAMLGSPNETEVARAAGALGMIGERNSPGAAAVEPALDPLGRLARSAPGTAVREAACRALARIAHPSAEQVLVPALEDADPGVRFSAAQGLGNLGRAAEETVRALGGRLLDDNKGVRQAVAAALGKLAGPDAARRLADRLKPGGEADAAVRNAFWAAIEAIVARTDGPELAEELADRFFILGGVEPMQRAAAMIEAALAKYPAAAAGDAEVRALRERLVDAYIAAATPERAVPSLRLLLDATPPNEKARIAGLKRQLGLILLARDPYDDGAALLGEAIEGLDAEARLPVVRAVHGRADALLKADLPGRALDVLNTFKRARPDWGGTEATAAVEALYAQAADAAIGRAVATVNGADEAKVAAAVARLKTLGRPAVLALLGALESAAVEGRADTEARLLAALEAVTGRKNHGYDLKAPLAARQAAIRLWRGLP